MASYLLPDGRTVSDSMAFTLDEVQYPSNWLLLSSSEEREDRGITGPLPEPPWYDQRFYWGPDQPKDHAQLVTEYVAHVRRNAGSILSDTDWMVIREQDNGTPVPQEQRDWRESVRQAAGAKISEIEQTADTAELAAYITGTDYPVWPLDPDASAGVPPADGVQPAVDGKDG